MTRILSLLFIGCLIVQCGSSANAAQLQVFVEGVAVAGGKVVTVLMEKKTDLTIAVVGSAIWDGMKYVASGSGESKKQPDQQPGETTLIPKTTLYDCESLANNSVRCTGGTWLIEPDAKSGLHALYDENRITNSTTPIYKLDWSTRFATDPDRILNPPPATPGPFITPKSSSTPSTTTVNNRITSPFTTYKPLTDLYEPHRDLSEADQKLVDELRSEAMKRFAAEPTLKFRSIRSIRSNNEGLFRSSLPPPSPQEVTPKAQ